MFYERSQALEERLQEILGLLRAERHSSTTLAQALDVSQPTVSRCLAALRKRGHEIRAIRDGHGWSFHLAAENKSVSTEAGQRQ